MTTRYSSYDIIKLMETNKSMRVLIIKRYSNGFSTYVLLNSMKLTNFDMNRTIEEAMHFLP